MPPLSSATCEPSPETVTPAHIAEWLTLSLEASPASRSPLPVPEREPMTSGTCGPQSSPCLARYDRASRSWRTSQGCLLSLMEGDPTFTAFSETWPSWGTTVGGELWALTMPALRTEESGCGSSDEWGTPNSHPRTHTPREVDHGVQLANQVAAQWPTPDAALGDGGKVSRGGARKDEALLAGMAKWPTPDANAMNLGESPESWDARRETLRAKHGNGNGAGRVLAVEASRWATPRSCSAAAAAFTDDAIAKAGERFPNLESQVQLATWSTPQARDEHTYAKTKRGANSPGGTPLTVQAVESRAWPAPTQRDHKDGGAEACANVPTNGLLGREVHQGAKTGSLALHPSWVECLQGWPIGWTSLEPLPELFWPALDGHQVAGPGQPQHPWEPPRVASGIKNRAKRLRCIGNGQHPFAAALAWRVLSAVLAAEGEEG